MSTVFLFISFLLHFVTFYLIIILFTKYRTIKQHEESQRKLLQEAEDALSLFLIEMKDENEKFLMQLQAKLGDQSESIMSHTSSHRTDEHDEQDVPKHLENLLQSKEDIIDMEEGDQEEDLRTKAFRLKKEGYTLEEIAKKLNVGKTEIELFIKFNENDGFPS